jgi:membrane protein implicated in regulation of membrane protease activity
LARPERGFVATLLGNSLGAIVARRMLPAFLVVILLGWIRTLTRSAGWFSPGFATAFLVVAVLVLLAVLIWLTALSLNRTDRERRGAELAMRYSEARLTALLGTAPRRHRAHRSRRAFPDSQFSAKQLRRRSTLVARSSLCRALARVGRRWTHTRSIRVAQCSCIAR